MSPNLSPTHRRNTASILLTLALGLGLLSFFNYILTERTPSAYAQTPTATSITYTVTSLEDAITGPPYSCEANCTLRDAINTASTTTGTDTIEFAAGLSGAIDLVTVLTIDSDVIINGPGADVLAVSISGNDFSNRRVLNVTAGVTVTLRDLTVQRSGEGDGGGIQNNGKFTVENSIIKDTSYNGFGGAFVNFALGTLTLLNSTLSNNLALQGGGIYNLGTATIISSTLQGNDANSLATEGSAIFNAGGVVSMTGSFIVDGKRGSAVANFEGGKITLSGATIENNNNRGIYIEGITTTLEVINSSFISNNGGIVNGGGIEEAVGGVVTVTGSIFTGNSASSGGAIHNRRGGVFTLMESTLTGNRAAFAGGGAIMNEYDATITVRDTTIDGNSAGGGATFGGGIFNQRGGIFLLENSTVSNNSADEVNEDIVNNFDSCGGIINSGINSNPDKPARMTIVNSTISGNRALEDGAGICVRGSAETSQVTITHSTITNNRLLAPNEDNGGAGIFVQNGSVTLSGVILAENYRDDGILDNLFQDVDSPGIVTSQGFNLSDSAPAGFGDDDLTNTPAGLGPLADNDGPTQTHALLQGSAAIDGGSNAICPATDQRGVARPFDGDENGSDVCDIGAVEMTTVITPPPPAESDLYLPLIEGPSVNIDRLR